jgi:uncharacterized SAM-binding protein YcdF (DUF218 family)
VRRIGLVLRALLLVWAGTFLGVLAVQLLWPRDEALPAPADAIVCLGADMSRQGWTLPGAASERRARTCADLQVSGVAPVVIFTGYGHEVYSAAEAMADVARGGGVPDEAMVIEPLARSTIQNAAFALDLLPAGADRIVVVSDPFHLPRSWAIFRLLGMQDIALHAVTYSVEEGPQERPVLLWTLRESLAIWSNIARLTAYFGAGALGVDEATRIGWFN